MKTIGYSDVERQLRGIFFDLLFRPLVGVISEATKQSVVLNAAEDWLREALRTGRVQYSDGQFSGQFSAKISSALRALGAKLDKRTGTFRLPPEKVPGWISAEAGHYRTRAEEAHNRVRKTLDEIEAGLGEKMKSVKVDASASLGDIQEGWKDVAKKMELPINLTPEGREKILERYSDNMNLWIEKFTKGEIKDLRRVVERSVTKGYRFDSLIDGIEHRYDVSRTKATFLARQETALLTSAFRRERFQENGFNAYLWRATKDERTRTSHMHLDGRVFHYSDPPIVDPATGRKGNPGEDFGCRCVDIPIVGSVVEAEMAAS